MLTAVPKAFVASSSSRRTEVPNKSEHMYVPNKRPKTNQSVKQTHTHTTALLLSRSAQSRSIKNQYIQQENTTDGARWKNIEGLMNEWTSLTTCCCYHIILTAVGEMLQASLLVLEFRVLPSKHFYIYTTHTKHERTRAHPHTHTRTRTHARVRPATRTVKAVTPLLELDTGLREAWMRA